MHDLILLDRHEVDLRAMLQNADGAESSAYVTYGRAQIPMDPWTKNRRLRFVSHTVSSVPEADKISASRTHVTWSTRSFVHELSKATTSGVCLGIVHTHPQGKAIFSPQDDVNEAELARSVSNRNGSGFPFVSLLFGGDGNIAARVWVDGAPHLIPRITISGRRLRFFGQLESADNSDDFLDRQARLFGKEVNDVLRDMRIAVVGAGGTGSPVVQLLLRLGVGKLLLIDKDVVEVTNLNRIHGSRRQDAVEGVAKVQILAREISIADLGVEVVPIQSWAGSPIAREALKACDVMFGCTDDHDGRSLLSRVAYFYGIPLIDVGLRMKRSDGPLPFNIVARTSLVAPGGACLMCRDIINPRRASEEALERTNPEEFGRRKAEAYVQGGGDPAPAVVTFTTEAATMAVNELIQGLTGYRGSEGMAWGRFRRFETLEDRVVSIPPRTGCQVCDSTSFWGLCDVDPFVYRAG